MKQCPVCNAVVFDDMDRCYGCLYQFDPESESKEPQKASGLKELEELEDAAEPRGAKTTGEIIASGGAETPDGRAESKDAKTPDGTVDSRDAETPSGTARSDETTGSSTAAESDTTAKPREIEGLHEMEEVHEVVHKTRVPAPEICRGAHGQTELTVRLELHLDFAPVQTASQDERCATVTDQTSDALSAITN